EGHLVRELLLGRWIADELDPLQEALAADVADDAVLLRQRLEAGAQPGALLAGIGAEVLIEDLAQDGDAGSAGDRIALEGVPLDEARVLADRPPEGVGNVPAADHR